MIEHKEIQPNLPSPFRDPWVYLGLIAAAIIAYMLLNELGPFRLGWSLDIRTYIHRSWVLITAFVIVAAFLKFATVKGLLTRIAFSVVATLALTPVPALIWGGLLPNGLIAYYFEPFTLLAFLGWPETRILAGATFALIFVLIKYFLVFDLEKHLALFLGPRRKT